MNEGKINRLACNDGGKYISDKLPKITEQRCILCNIPYMCKLNFFHHLIGKRHIKNSKNKRNDPQAAEKTLRVGGIPTGSFFEVFEYFWSYGIVDASIVDSCSFIEFETLEAAQKAYKDAPVIKGQKLAISFKAMNNSSISTKMAKKNSKGNISLAKKFDEINISSRLAKLMDEIVDENGIDLTILQLIGEIELKQHDYQERCKVRSVMEKFLQQMFPTAQTFIFGSSVNSLGFTGCDIDMYVNLGVNPWAYGTKEQMERQAATLTNDIAREIRRKRRGYDVVPIARARVPIVKFKDYYTGIDVDLSFRSPMPIYNTSLIKLYTNTHKIVRPYLILLRYWGKIQDVVGGGKPTTLLTNYCYTMMMLFWIMYRNPPIIPSVSELKYKLYLANLPIKPGMANVVNGWDCSYSEDVREWTNIHHNTTLINLAEEFFEFYSKFDAVTWVISPLIGQFLSKMDLGSQNRYCLPPILHPYCNVAKFQSNTPLCVQDPFEHNHNIARGLNAYSLMAFQYKCQKAAEVCKLIRQKNASLSLLFKPIKVEAEVSNQINKCEQVDNKNERTNNNLPVGNIDDDDDDDDDNDIAILFEIKNDSKLQKDACCSTNLENLSKNNATSPTTSSQDSILAIDSINKHFESHEENQVDPVSTSDSFDNQKQDIEVIEGATKVVETIDEITIDNTTCESEFDFDSPDLIIIDEDNGVSEDDCSATEYGDKKQSTVIPVSLLNAEKEKIEDAVDCKSIGSLNSIGSELVTSPILEPLKCDFYFNAREEFTIDSNGNINVLKGKLMTLHLRENKVKELIKFVLSSCLMCHIEDCRSHEIKENKSSLKRKFFAIDDSKKLLNDSVKLFKNESGNASKVQSEYTHLFRIKCTHILCPWVKRGIMSKKLIRGKNSLLHYEKTLSDLLAKKHKNVNANGMVSYVNIWKKTTEPSRFCVTCKENTIKPTLNTFNFMEHFFQLFSRIVKDAFVDTSRYIKFIS